MGLWSSTQPRRSFSAPPCFPSVTQHTALFPGRARSLQLSHSFRKTFLASPAGPKHSCCRDFSPCRHACERRMSFLERSRLLPVPEEAFLPCFRAKWKLSVHTRLENRRGGPSRLESVQQFSRGITCCSALVFGSTPLRSPKNVVSAPESVQEH